MKFNKLIALATLALSALLLPLTGRAADSHTPENRVIYEVFVRNFSPQGNLKGVEAQIPRLKQMGVDVIWLMPIYKLADTGKWGTYSSPYAVKDYKQIDPANGTDQDLRDLVKTIHNNGMEIWLDWVANHTGMDHVWISQHPEYYSRSNGQFIHPFGWGDVYELARDNSAMQDAMVDCLKYWVDNFDIDGFRCDYAAGPSRELWRKASSQVLKNGKRVAWLAEDGSQVDLVSKGYFDYNYCWEFNDRLLDFAGSGNVASLRQACQDLHNASGYSGRSRMIYLSNHDIVQDRGGSAARLYGSKLKPLTVLEFTMYGMPLIYNGDEVASNYPAVSLAEKTPVNWNGDASMTTLLTKLCELKHTQPALNTGSGHTSLTNLTASDGNVYAYQRGSGDKAVFVLLNFSSRQTTFTVAGNNLPGHTATDVFTGNQAKLSSGQTFTLPAYGYAVYVRKGNEPELGEPEVGPIPAIYIQDETGWGDLFVYAYANDVPGIFGGWPGQRVADTEVINGVTYRKLPFPADGQDYSLIFNNNAGQQFDGPYVPSGRDLYLKLTASGYTILPTPSGGGNNSGDDSEAKIIILDKSGWSDLFVYAYANDADGLYGGWPGKQVTTTEVINGVTYKTIPFPGEGQEYNLIFHNNAGQQFDGPYAPSGQNLYVEITSTGFTIIPKPEGGGSGAGTDVPDQLYIIGNLTGHSWDPAYGISMTRSGDTFTAEKVEFTAVDDNTTAFFSLTSVLSADWSVLDGHRYGATADGDRLESGISAGMKAYPDNAAAWQLEPATYDIVVNFSDMTICATRVNTSVSTVGSTSVEAEYFNLQGQQVASPQQGGIYIVRRGSQVTKECY